jgi:hypothetical protein
MKLLQNGIEILNIVHKMFETSKAQRIALLAKIFFFFFYTQHMFSSVIQWNWDLIYFFINFLKFNN